MDGKPSLKSAILSILRSAGIGLAFGLGLPILIAMMALSLAAGDANAFGGSTGGTRRKRRVSRQAANSNATANSAPKKKRQHGGHVSLIFWIRYRLSTTNWLGVVELLVGAICAVGSFVALVLVVWHFWPAITASSS